MVALSVVICTHNPRLHLLGRTLEGLRRQSLPTDAWELLVVDNASSEPVSHRADVDWHPQARIVREDELGLTAARVRGIHETHGDLIVFVDDDNVLGEDYLARTIAIANTHTMLGCFGAGRLVPEFEEAPAAELLPHTRILALREVEHPRWSNYPDDDLFPWGAGLVARRRVADGFAAVVASDGLNTAVGRRGSSLASGEDELFGWVALGLGLGKGIFPELEVLHLIPQERLDFQYLLRLHRAQAQSYALLHEWQGRRVPVPDRPAQPLDVLRHLRRLDVTTACKAAVSWLVHRHDDPHTAMMADAWRRGIADHEASRETR